MFCVNQCLNPLPCLFHRAWSGPRGRTGCTWGGGWARIGGGRGGRPLPLRSRREATTRKAITRKARLAICALAMVLLQVSVTYRFSYGILRLDSLYLLAAFMALEADLGAALWSALAIGLLRDLASAGRLGGSALVLVPAAAALFAVRDRLWREPVLVDVMLVFAFALFCGAVEGTVVAIVGEAAGWGAMLAQALGQAVVTAALCPLFFALFRLAGVVDAHESVLV